MSVEDQSPSDKPISSSQDCDRQCVGNELTTESSITNLKLLERQVVAAPPEDAELQVKAEEEKASYEQLKMELQVWTIAVSVFGFGASWLAYSQVRVPTFLSGSVATKVWRLRHPTWHIHAQNRKGTGM